MAGDTFYNPDPLTAGTAGDVFQNTAGGDVWFDVITWFYQDTTWGILHAWAQDTAWDILNDPASDISWDILNVFLQNTSWDILKENEQDIAWSVFAEVLYFLEQIYVKKICFELKTAYGEYLGVDAWDANIQTTFYPKQQCFTINTQEGDYLGVPVGQESKLIGPQNFGFQLTHKVKYTFRPQTVHGAGIENFEQRN